MRQVCIFIVILLVTASVSTATGNKDAAIQQDRKAFEATWTFILYKEDGVKAKDDALEKSPVIIDAKGNMRTDQVEATTIIDPSKKPKTIDITYKKGKRYVGKTVRGIYEIDGDTCRICYAPPGENRPTEFTAKSGSEHVLMAFKRNKD